VVGALAVDDLLLGVEALAAEAVVAAVLAEVDLAGVPQLLQHGLHDAPVPRLGRADVVAVLQAQRVPGAPELRRVPVGQRLRADARPGRRLGDLLTVLVGASEEEGLLAEKPAIARHRVGEDRGVRVPQVRRVVDIVDRRGEIECATHGLTLAR
jgi:hypothetical protein